MRLMSVTRDTSQVPMGPCGLVKHLPFADSLRHASTAPLSCTLDSGENAGVGRANRSEFKFAREVDESAAVRGASS